MEYIFTTLLVVITAVLTALHFWIHKCRCGSFVNKIPGPGPIPLVGNVLDLLTSSEGFWDFFRTCSDNYYSIYKIWIVHVPVVNLRHPDDIKVVLSSQKNITKSPFYDFLHPWLNGGLLTSTGNKWRRRRATLTPAFHFNMLQEFIGVFTENVERMVDTLKKENGEIVKDLAPFIANFALRTICESAMGTVLGDDDSVQEEYINSVQQMGDIAYIRCVRPWLWFRWILSLTQTGRDQAKALKILHDFTETIIKSRKKYHEETGGKYLKVFSSDTKGTEHQSVPSSDVPLKKKRLALLDLLIAAQKGGDDIDDLGIREEVDTFIFEGYDTTALALTFALLLLAEHKDIQARARAEFDSVLKESDGKLGINEAQNLQYLERCIKESLRIFPSVPVVSREVTNDLYLKKYMLPHGAIANVQIFDVHRDPKFWPQPQVYDPDRFLPSRINSRHPFSFIPFSGGARSCIGFGEKGYTNFGLRRLIFFVTVNVTERVRGFFMRSRMELSQAIMFQGEWAHQFWIATAHFLRNSQCYGTSAGIFHAIKNGFIASHYVSGYETKSGKSEFFGQKFAMLELKVFVGYLLHSFYLEPMIEVSKVRFAVNLVLKSPNPLNVKFIPIP